MGAVSTAFVQQYNDTLMLLVQQKGSRLRDTVLVDTNFTGEYKFYDQLGSTTMTQITTRHQDTPITDPDHERRRISKENYVVNFLFDWTDDINMLINPTSKYQQNAAFAAGRQIDTDILAAAGATAYSGKTGSSSTTLVSYDSGSHVITSTSGLTVDKILDTKELLDLAECDPDEPRYYVITPREIKDLLNTTEVKSSDYNTVKALARGDMGKDTWCGFKWIMSNRVTRSSGTDVCYAYLKSGIQLGISKDIETRMDERPDKNYSLQVYTCMAIGAVRLEEEKVVQNTVTNA